MKSRFSLAIPALLSVCPALADVSFDQRFTVEAGGAMSMFGSEGTSQTQLTADRSRMDSNITMKSALVSMFAGSGESSSIVRLDKELTWELMPDKQQYSELTFAQARAQIAEAQAAMKDAQGSASPGAALPVSTEGCEWTEGETQVEQGDGIETVAGLDTRKHVIRVKQSCTDPETKKTCDITWLMETWLAKNVPGEQQARQFQQAYATAMGLDEVMRQAQGPAQSLLSMFTGNWKEVVAEVAKLDGFPLRTAMQMGIGGEQCTTASGQPITSDEAWTGAEGGSTGESVGSAIGGSLGGAAGAAAGQLIGGLSGMFGNKTAEPAATQAAPQTAPGAGGGEITVFRITTETTRWSDAPVPAERFEVPAGWKRI
jgi:hypothetical protein